VGRFFFGFSRRYWGTSMRIYENIWHENVWELDLRFEIYQSKGSLFQHAQTEEATSDRPAKLS
jgi:hypothetical protein